MIFKGIKELFDASYLCHNWVSVVGHLLFIILTSFVYVYVIFGLIMYFPLLFIALVLSWLNIDPSLFISHILYAYLIFSFICSIVLCILAGAERGVRRYKEKEEKETGERNRETREKDEKIRKMGKEISDRDKEISEKDKEIEAQGLYIEKLEEIASDIEGMLIGADSIDRQVRAEVAFKLGNAELEAYGENDVGTSVADHLISAVRNDPGNEQYVKTLQDYYSTYWIKKKKNCPEGDTWVTSTDKQIQAIVKKGNSSTKDKS